MSPAHNCSNVIVFNLLLSLCISYLNIVKLVEKVKKKEENEMKLKKLHFNLLNLRLTLSDYHVNKRRYSIVNPLAVNITPSLTY